MRHSISIALALLVATGCGAGNSINGSDNDNQQDAAAPLPDVQQQQQQQDADTTLDGEVQQLDSEVQELCGNSVIDPGEVCDQQNFGGMSCHILGFEGGELACTAECQLDTNACIMDMPECGDGTVDAGEQCDGQDLSGLACDDLGFAGGALACRQDCLDYDTAACWMNPPTCGNGQVEPGETCDDGNGVLTDGCPDGPSGTCHTATCGDGFVEASVESCDDGNHSTADDCPDGPQGSCEWAFCGDGYQHGMDETCDDGPGGACYDDCSGSCGDGVCAGDEINTCSADCDCVALGGIVCATGCCYAPVGETGQCCQYGLCVVWSGANYPVNCGSCGNDCMYGSGWCVNGQCM